MRRECGRPDNRDTELVLRIAAHDANVLTAVQARLAGALFPATFHAEAPAITYEEIVSDFHVSYSGARRRDTIDSAGTDSAVSYDVHRRPLTVDELLAL